MRMPRNMRPPSPPMAGGANPMFFFQISPKNPKSKKFKKISSVGERLSIEDSLLHILKQLPLIYRYSPLILPDVLTLKKMDGVALNSNRGLASCARKF